MKVALCITCTDIVAPFNDWAANRAWRWCQCERVGVRWRDGTQGLLEIVSRDGAGYVRVIGLNNAFLAAAVSMPMPDAQAWQELHEWSCREVPPRYLFHEDRRRCWALIVRPGESDDVFLMDFASATPPGG